MSMTFTNPRLAALDGFRVEIDAARERGTDGVDHDPQTLSGATDRHRPPQAPPAHAVPGMRPA